MPIYMIWMLMLVPAGEKPVFMGTYATQGACEMSAHEFRVQSPKEVYKCTGIKTATDLTKLPEKEKK